MKNEERNQKLKQNIVTIFIVVTISPLLLILLVSKLCILLFARSIKFMFHNKPYETFYEWRITRKMIKISNAIITM